MSRIVSVSLPEEAWGEVISALDARKTYLCSGSEKAPGAYREILEVNAQEISNILYEIETELNFT